MKAKDCTASRDSGDLGERRQPGEVSTRQAPSSQSEGEGKEKAAAGIIQTGDILGRKNGVWVASETRTSGKRTAEKQIRRICRCTCMGSKRGEN